VNEGRFDQKDAVPVVDQPARRPQGERPLVVVFGHLLVLVVLNDLENPEADGERRKRHDDADVKHDEPLANPPAILALGQLHTLVLVPNDVN
jgi:hypothetical protein